MLILENNRSENLIASNHFFRDHEPWPPMMAYDNGISDDFGLLKIHGNHNSIIANHISETIARRHLKPEGVRPVMIHIASGQGNYISGNHIVVGCVREAGEEDSCFGVQVSALLHGLQNPERYGAIGAFAPGIPERAEG